MSHTFFSKSIKNSLVIPNRIVVSSFPDDTDQYTGSYTSAASFALMPAQGAPVRTKLTRDAQAIAIATAMISHIEVASQRGSATVPMNVGAELFDYVLVTDQRAGDTRTGNIGYLTRLYDRRNYQMTFGFGGVAVKKVPGTQLAELNTIISEADMMAEETVKWGAILPTLKQTAIAIDKMQKAMIDILTGLDYYDNALPFDEQIDGALVGYLKKLQDDSSPTLGGSLQANGHSIRDIVNGVSIVAGNQNVNLTGGGSLVIIDGNPPTASNALATKDYVDDSISGASYLENVVEDTTPQLGGNLDCNGKQITGAGVISSGAGAMYQTAGSVNHVWGADGSLDMGDEQIHSVVDPDEDQDAATKKYVDDSIPSVPTHVVATKSDVTASRSFDTQYQNTSGNALAVDATAYVESANVDTLFFLMDSASHSPWVVATYCVKAQEMDRIGGYTKSFFHIGMIVPDDWYYVIVTNSGDAVKYKWIETQLSVA